MDDRDEMALVGSLAGLAPWQISAMEAGGWSVTRLATLDGGGRDLLKAVVWRLQQRDEHFKVELDSLQDMVRRAATRAYTRHQLDAKRGGQDLLEAHVAHQRQVRQKIFGDYVAEDVKSKVQPVGTAKRSRWPTRLGLKLHIASTDVAMRELAEKQERDRWLGEIRNIMKRARLPVALRSSEEALLIRVAKGRRPNTLRKHVKTWAKASRWLKVVHDCEWPKTASQFAEFLEAMVEEPCARSFPESIYKTLMFLEHAGEVPEQDQLYRSPAVKNALEEAAHRLQNATMKETRKAVLLPVAVIMAWETHVVNEEAPRYPRIYAWFRLIKLWTGMRFDDTKGAPNRTMEMFDWGLKGVINRSKTSGPGKRIVLLPFYVHKDAWLCESRWLAVGWKLWTAMGSEAGLLGRDFMLPWPNSNRNGFIRKMVDYPIASTMSQALFNEITQGKGDQRQLVLKPGVGVIWTEHSERSTIRTWAQAARIPEDVRKMIGRWKPSADEGYERNVRTNVLRCQKVLAVYIKENLANSDPFDETMVVQLAEQRMQDLGYGQEELDEQSMRLMTFMPGDDVAKPCRKPNWTTTGPVVLVEETADIVEIKVEPMVEAEGENDLEGVETERKEIMPVDRITGMFVVSIVGRSKTRTLHKIGECHRQPGVHYATFEVLGEETPSTAEYHRACKQCFGHGVEAASALEEETSGDVSSSELSDSEEEEESAG